MYNPYTRLVEVPSCCGCSAEEIRSWEVESLGLDARLALTYSSYPPTDAVPPTELRDGQRQLQSLSSVIHHIAG